MNRRPSQTGVSMTHQRQGRRLSFERREVRYWISALTPCCQGPSASRSFRIWVR
jgi:hypothetical protein